MPNENYPITLKLMPFVITMEIVVVAIMTVVVIMVTVVVTPETFR